MKCPKCGYTSFDYLDRCKSCGEDLVPTKIKLNIYTKQPEIEINDDGFAVEKLDQDRKDLLEQDTVRKDVSVDDVLKEEGENLESFDFSEDEKS
jgi:predicted  nucleic acid-binding Zn-ribbon protein